MRTWYKVPQDIRVLEFTEQGYNTAFKRQIKFFYLQMLLDKYDVNVPCVWVSDCNYKLF